MSDRIVLTGTVGGKRYWSIVSSVSEAQEVILKLTRLYRKAYVWMEDLQGKVLVSFERLVDRMRFKAPKKRSVWTALGVIVGVMGISLF
jgi:hypothetical protein